jgi:starvation-inducible DNA-binding protein
MNINIGITNSNLKQSVSILETLLANEMTLYVKTRKAHWNVSGDSFMELHKLFQNQYEELEESIDQIAERIGKLGHKTIGTMEEFAKLSQVKEYPGKYDSSKAILLEILCDHESIIIELRKNISLCSDKYNDLGTADYLTGLMEQHETISWILRRYTN